MKKKGFTLAEVLITLAIIGTIAAITLPALMTDTTTAQIGPKLAKAVSMFEQANEAILNENSVDTLSEAGLLSSTETYCEELSRHLKGTAVKLSETTATIAGAAVMATEALDRSETGPSSEFVNSGTDRPDGRIELVTPTDEIRFDGHSSAGDSETSEDPSASLYNKSTTGFLTKDGMLYTFHILGALPKNTSDPGHMQEIGMVAIDINGNSMPNIDGTDRFYFSWWNDGSLRPKGATNWSNSSKVTWQEKCPRDAEPTDAKYCAGHIFENNLKVLYR